MSHRSTYKLLGLLGAAVVSASALAATALGGHKAVHARAQDVATWSLPNATLGNTRAVSSSIDSSNVSKLSVAWRIPLTHVGATFGYLASTPVFGADGTMYFQDLAYNVFAANGSTGKILWTRPASRGMSRVDASAPKGEGPNGVVLSKGVVYGVTPTYAFALDARTGKDLWRTPKLVENQGQGLNIAPEVNAGRVFLSTSGQLHGGIAYALDAKTGKILWRFQETKNPAERTVGGHYGTGGAWNTPAIGPDGTVYYGIANPYRSINDAIEHPRNLLYNDSLVALTPQGRLKWHFQAVPNDFHDWDMQVSPIYTEINGKTVVVGSGKMGYVYVVDAANGKLISKTPVGKHNGHDNDGLLAQQHKFKPKLPYVYYPGIFGGVETNMAIADGVAYVPVVNLSSTYTTRTANLGTPQPFSKGTGDLEAVDLANGKVLWDRKLPQMAFGDATVTNDLVFTTTFDGKLYAVSRTTGAIVRRIQLSAGTNAPVAIDGNMLVTAASLPTGKGQKAQIVAYRLP